MQLFSSDGGRVTRVCSLPDSAGQSCLGLKPPPWSSQVRDKVDSWLFQSCKISFQPCQICLASQEQGLVRGAEDGISVPSSRMLWASGLQDIGKLLSCAAILLAFCLFFSGNLLPSASSHLSWLIIPAPIYFLLFVHDCFLHSISMRWSLLLSVLQKRMLKTRKCYQQ